MKIKSNIMCNYCYKEEELYHDSKESIDSILNEKGWVEHGESILCSDCASIESNLDEKKLTIKKAIVNYVVYGCRDTEEHFCPTCRKKIECYSVNDISKDVVRCPRCGQRLDKNSMY